MSGIQGYELPKARLYDVDGTLCDISSIRYLVDDRDPRYPGHRNYDKFHTYSIDCPPHRRVIDAVAADILAGIGVLVVTARAERFRTLTRWWLQTHGVYAIEQLHRAEYDFRPDTDVKREILADLRQRYTIIGAWDDNPKVIDLWKAEGLHVDVMPGWPVWP